jgi:hypothetical protein
MRYIVALTRSQQMALIDLIAHSLRCRCDSRIEEFIDASTSPTVRTSPGELLRLVSEAPAFADGGSIRDEPANENAGSKKDLGYQWPGKGRQG